MALTEFLTKVQEEFSVATAAILTAAGGVYLAYQRILKLGKADEHKVAESVAHIDVIEMLRQEIARLSEQNTKLAEIVNKLQSEIIELRDENAQILRRLHDR